MEGTAVLGRLRWQVAEVIDVVEETPLFALSFSMTGALEKKGRPKTPLSILAER